MDSDGRSRACSRRLGRFAGRAWLRSVAAGALGLVLVGALWGTFGRSLSGRSILTLFWLGPPLLEVRTPQPGEWIPRGGLGVVVVFPDEARVVPETFRCQLNGVDVTATLTLGKAGATGAIYPIRAGRNSLRVEIFGKSWWTRALLEDTIELEFWTHPMPPLDRA